MKDPEFHRQQWDRRFAEHIAPVNQLVESLLAPQDERWLPYVAPLYEGINAELLNVLRDPGPKTQSSKFICLENDDPTAENMCSLLSVTGIDPSRTLLWNAYPWYINRDPRAKQLTEGARVFCKLLKLLPRLRVLMLNGRSAQDMWKRAQRQGATLPTGAVVIETFHTSNRAVNNPSQRKHVEDAFKQAYCLMRDSGEAQPDR